MLKFSGFANLTSCLATRDESTEERDPKATTRVAEQTHKALSKLAVEAEPCQSNASRAPNARPEARAIAAACPA